jgi:flavin-dependent dehydrogenase
VTGAIDLAVVGGGPVGLATAVAAATAGLSVIVLEARDGDGDKACGEGLMPSAVAALQQWGVDPPGYDVTGITYRRGPRAVTGTFAEGPGRGVRRTALVAALRARVHDLGVVVRQERVGALTQRPTSVIAGSVSARYVAVADGLHSPLRRSLGLEGPRRGSARYGQRRHYACSPWGDTVEVTWADDCEAYVTPVGPGEIGVAVLSSRRARYDDLMSRFPLLRERLGGASPTSRVRGAGPLRQSSTARVCGRALLVGDAAGYVDALTGEGLAVGFASAQALVTCIAADRPDAYERTWRAATRRPRLVTHALLGATRRPSARRALVPAAQLFPGVFRGAVNLLA